MLNLPSGFAKVLQICVSDWHAAAQPLLNWQCQSVYQSDMSSDNPAFSLTGLDCLLSSCFKGRFREDRLSFAI